MPAHDERTQAEWETDARALLDAGDAFRAYDVAKAGLRQHPGAMKLIQTAVFALKDAGALEEARTLLEPLVSGAALSNETLKGVFSSLREVVGTVGETDEPSDSDLSHLGEQLVGLRALSRFWERGMELDSETIGSMAAIYKEIYRRAGGVEDASRSKDLYLRGFRSTGAYWLGINAATMSLLQGEAREARRLASEVYSICTNSGEEDYWTMVTIGEALLVLGNKDDGVRAYREALRKFDTQPRQIVSSLTQLHLLRDHGIELPEELFEILKAPTVIAFTGHMLDRPGGDPRFPPWLDIPVRKEIDEALSQLEPRDGHAIGYCSAACGADILFAEALLDRGDEVNIVLPFDLADFEATSVGHAGAAWVRRFRQTLSDASSVTYATEELYLNDDVLFSFNAMVVNGRANLRAKSLVTEPHLVAVWDGKDNALVGGTSDTVKRWADRSTLLVIDLDRVLREASEVCTDDLADVAAPVVRKGTFGTETWRGCDRFVKTMLFADIKGFSSLKEEHIPFYVYTFLDHVSNQLIAAGVMTADREADTGFVNTWGDAIFAVKDDACSMVEYALALQRVVCDTDWSELGFTGQMSIRIGLHAGPVYEGKDPITGRPNYYGSHVNRAARIEPVTVPGYIYASEQFVCMLTMEQIEARKGGEDCVPEFACEPVGTIELAKDFGSQAIFMVRSKVGGAASG